MRTRPGLCTLWLLLTVPVIPLYAQLPYVDTTIPVRDGKALAADIYHNGGNAAKPVVLVQTPYNRTAYRLSLGRPVSVFPLDTTSYHYVFVDWRGFYGSTSAAVPGYDRGLDGYDIVEWIATQPWCNGKVATIGGSALGNIQFLTARHHPPHLVCASPTIIDYRNEYSDYYYHGVLRHEHVSTLERLGFLTVDAITSRPVENALWDVVRNQSDFPEDIAVPLLMCTGWYDHYPSDIVRAFHDLRERSDAKVRDQHKIIIGPWSHGEVDLAEQGDLRFPNATLVYRDAVLQFLAYHLLGAKNGWPLQPAVRYYEMGSNIWKSTASWESIATTPLTLHMHSNGRLGEPRSSDEGVRILAYDPRYPSPSYGGARFNPFDPDALPGPLDIAGTVESRPDALLFTSDALDEALSIVGMPRVDFTIRSDRTDTDVSVRLCDVYPDGRSIILSDGIRRMRFRDGTDRERLMQPGTAYTSFITLPVVAHSIQPGHRIRVVLSSSDWPRFDRNLNNGGTMYSPGDTVVATNSFIFSTTAAAALTLDVVPGPTPVWSTAEPMPVSLGVPYPHPFDGNALTLSIPVTTGEAHATCTITDALGRTLATWQLARGTSTTLRWNGLDTRGQRVPPGMYSIRLAHENGVLYRSVIAVR